MANRKIYNERKIFIRLFVISGYLLYNDIAIYISASVKS